MRDEHGNFPTAGFPPSNPARGPADEKIDYALRATPRAEEARRGLLAILNAIAGLLPVKDGEGGREEEEEEILVIGSLHTCLLPLLTSPTDHHHNLFPFQRVLSRSRAANPTSGVLSGIEQATYKYLIPPAPPSTPTNNSSSNGSDDAGGVLSGIGQATYKYLIPPAPSTLSSSDGISGLGRGKGKKGYVLSELRSSELGICIANTDIPRTEEGLGMLRSVCVRYCSPPVEEQPREKKRGVGGEGEERDKGKGKGDGYREEGEVVAWAFLGADGSFSSLHTMPEHRGKGLAGAVVRGLMRKGEGWMSSDVYWDNEGGKGVARGLGGREGWVVHWVGCDLEAVRRVWGWHGS